MENFENDNEGQDTLKTKKVGRVCGKVSSNLLLCTSLGMLVVATGLKCLGHRHSALLVAQCGASLLLFGAYNKILPHKRPKPNLI